MFTDNTFLRSGVSATLITLPLFLTACASAPPKEAVSNADVAIQNADRAGAAQYEPELLSSARIKLNRANKYMEEDENDDARRMAEEARAEAVLASAKAEEAKQAKQATEMQKTIEALRQETSRVSEDQ